MRWAVRWRKELATGQYFQLLQRGFIKPEDQEPQISGFEFYFDAFRELSSCRPVGMELSPIPFTAIAEYSKIYALEDFDEFAEIMRYLDNTFLEVSEAARKKEGDGNGGANNADKKNSNKN